MPQGTDNQGDYMTDTISISLKNVQNIKTVNIEGVGVFRVRKLGAGEELDLSTKRRKMISASNEIVKIKSKIDSIKDLEEQERLATKELPRIDKLTEELTNIKAFELETYKKCFSADKPELVDELLDSLSEEERTELFNQIFGTPKIIEKEETIETETDEK